MKCTFPMCRFCMYLVWSPKDQDFICMKDKESHAEKVNKDTIDDTRRNIKEAYERGVDNDQRI